LTEAESHHSLSVNRGGFSAGAPATPGGLSDVARLNQLLRELGREVERLSQRNAMLERRLQSITGALQGTLRARLDRPSRGGRSGLGSRRRGAPRKFSDLQARQLRRDYEAGATSARLARKYRAALPTILSTLRRAGTTLRRGRPPNK